MGRETSGQAGGAGWRAFYCHNSTGEEGIRGLFRRAEGHFPPDSPAWLFAQLPDQVKLLNEETFPAGINCQRSLFLFLGRGGDCSFSDIDCQVRIGVSKNSVSSPQNKNDLIQAPFKKFLLN